MPPRTSISLSAAADAYAAHVRATGVSENTVKNKTQIVIHALREWGDMQVRSIRPVHVDNLFAAGGWSTSTRNLYLGNLRMFFAWCRHQGHMGRDSDPTFGWRNQRVSRDERLRVPVEQFPDLLDAATHPRDRAVLALGLFTFLRASEIVTLKIGDLDLSAMELSIYRHKTRQYDVLPVVDELREEMVRWFNWYRADTNGLQPNWYLTPAKHKPSVGWADGQRVAIQTDVHLRPEAKVTHVYEIAQRALVAIGYDPGREGCHTLRRSGSRALFDALRSEGYDGALMRVSSMLGHADTRITERYIGLDLERSQRNALLAGRRMFPQMQRESGLRVVREGDSG